MTNQERKIIEQIKQNDLSASYDLLTVNHSFLSSLYHNEYSNAKISETLQSYAIVNGTQMPILSVFSKNKSLLQFLQENKKSCKVNVEGDVMRIEKA